MKGYKAMLRDRMPEMLDLALRYCKAKNRWIDYVYDNMIKREPQNKRSNAVKTILGIKQQYKRQYIYDQIRYSELKKITKEQVQNIPKSELYMKFNETINWEKLSCDSSMYNYWKDVSEWVDWFSKSYIPIKDTYDHAKSWNMEDKIIIPILMNKYGINRKLTEFLIKSFK
jgi:hypothetical protein